MAFAPRNTVCFTILTQNKERMESGHLNNILVSAMLFTWLIRSVFFEEKKNIIQVIFLYLSKQQTLEYFRNTYLKMALGYEGCSQVNMEHFCFYRIQVEVLQ